MASSYVVSQNYHLTYPKPAFRNIGYLARHVK